jgi:hypothetical protein
MSHGRGAGRGRGRGRGRGKKGHEEPKEEKPVFEFSTNRVVMMRQLAQMQAEADRKMKEGQPPNPREIARAKRLEDLKATAKEITAMRIEEQHMHDYLHGMAELRKRQIAREKLLAENKKKEDRMLRELEQRLEGRHHPTCWACDQVAEWVSKLDKPENQLCCSFYSHLFEEHEINGKDLFKMTADTLSSRVGIEKLKPRKELMKHIVKLKREWSSGKDDQKKKGMGGLVDLASHKAGLGGPRSLVDKFRGAARRARLIEFDRVSDIKRQALLFSDEAQYEAAKDLCTFDWPYIVEHGLTATVLRLSLNDDEITRAEGVHRRQTQMLLANLLHRAITGSTRGQEKKQGEGEEEGDSGEEGRSDAGSPKKSGLNAADGGQGLQTIKNGAIIILSNLAQCPMPAVKLTVAQALNSLVCGAKIVGARRTKKHMGEGRLPPPYHFLHCDMLDDGLVRAAIALLKRAFKGSNFESKYRIAHRELDQQVAEMMCAACSKRLAIRLVGEGVLRVLSCLSKTSSEETAELCAIALASLTANPDARPQLLLGKDDLVLPEDKAAAKIAAAGPQAGSFAAQMAAAKVREVGFGIWQWFLSAVFSDYNHHFNTRPPPPRPPRTPTHIHTNTNISRRLSGSGTSIIV